MHSSHFSCEHAGHFTGELTVRFADLQSLMQQTHVPDDMVEFWPGRSNMRRTKAPDGERRVYAE